MGYLSQNIQSFTARILLVPTIRFVFPVLILLISLAMSGSLSANDKRILEQAANLLGQKKSLPAYQLLEKYEDEYAGWWEYDYLLGVAALESGKANLAIFALQRTLAMNPNLVGAHIDLGRAYFDVNELTQAKSEFEIVLQNKPSIRVGNIAKKFIHRINTKANPVRFSSRYFLETIAGYDSNANSATETKVFNGFTLSDENLKTPSTYLSLKAGANLYTKINKKNSLSLIASISQRENQKLEKINYIGSNVVVAWGYQHRYAQQTLGVQFGRTNISTNIESRTAKINFALKFRLVANADLRLNGSIGNNAYNKALSSRDAVQTMVGVSLSKKSKKPRIPSFTLSVIASENSPREGKSTVAKTLLGARIRLQKKWLKRKSITSIFSSGIMVTSYKQKLNAISRDDKFTDVRLSLSIQPWKSWETSLKTAYTTNRSSIELYRYSRINYALAVKKYF